MIDGASGADRSIVQSRVSAPENAVAKTRVDNGSPADDKAVTPPAQALADDELVLSEAAMAAFRSGGDDSFDSDKVAAIKQAISSGNYPLDSRRIAESFVTLERMIGGPGA